MDSQMLCLIQVGAVLVAFFFDHNLWGVEDFKVKKKNECVYKLMFQFK